MKKSFLLLLSLIFLALPFNTATAQKKKNQEPITIPKFVVDDKTSRVIYKEAVEEKGEQADLYTKGLKWFNSFYKSPASVIKSKDEASATISGTGRFYIKYSDPKSGSQSNAGLILYDITLECKDGRYRYTITNIKKKEKSYFGIENWIDGNAKSYDQKTADYLLQIHNHMEDLIKQLKAGMGPQEEIKDDW